MQELFNAVTVSKARALMSRHLSLPVRAEKMRIPSALGHCLLDDVTAAIDVPGFDRATVDGFAVRAGDTFGASEGMPAYLEVAGEVLMGQAPDVSLEPGRAWRIATGGMLPTGADAVVMVEHTEELDERTIVVTRPVAPGENVIRKGEDIEAGQLVLSAGHRLRPQDLGILAAVGITEVEVRRPLKVGIVSTGDEIVSPEQTPGAGQVRDINSYTLYGAVLSNGGEPILYGIVPDRFDLLQKKLAQAWKENDMVLLSGGSSVGVRDVADRVIQSLGRPGVLFHGLSIKPGKPTVGAVIEGKPVFGLPGHPVSTLVVFELLVAPLVRLGRYPEEDFLEFPLRARITRNIRSAAGREDYIRVKLVLRQQELWAEPVLGKSGLISNLVKADGLARISAEKEGVEAGETVEVKLL
ncbi:molybdopterin molybdotransferase MoeA [Calderihabitans maritimus]|uniref:Molybdopterin molybdenumtransferase n=1 Tax=Calderihabitans maritimus TaxID=1246530 RepID=A0A1Z5HRM2_9FIRM|nr:gephyrin-like molybdotransferase Glp [Calderihabitans maritimus]GAW92183.1 molybdenum cofactor synthesis domain-containing protein [Calderihabitans maritimus]